MALTRFRFSVVVLSQKIPKGEKHWNPLGPKQKSALELYDELREKAGFDAWDVVYHSKNDGEPRLSWSWPENSNLLDLSAGPSNRSNSYQAKPRNTTHTDVRIPQINLSQPSSTDKQEREDWETSLAEFQEWLGLACMGSQR